MNFKLKEICTKSSMKNATVWAGMVLHSDVPVLGGWVWRIMTSRQEWFTQKEPISDHDMENIIFNSIKPILIVCLLFENGKEVVTSWLKNYIKLWIIGFQKNTEILNRNKMKIFGVWNPWFSEDE